MVKMTQCYLAIYSRYSIFAGFRIPHERGDNRPMAFQLPQKS